MEWDKDKIRAFRKRLSLTQYQFAELLGTSRVLISNWETGKQSPCGMSQKFLTLLAFKDISRDIEEIKSKEQEFGEISGEKILALREKLSLSQTEFASRLGRNHSTISYWESREISPSKKSLQALRELALREGISLEELGKESSESPLRASVNSQEGCSGSETSNPQNNGVYNMGGANFTAGSSSPKHDFSPAPKRGSATALSTEIKAVGAGIDTLYIGFYVDVNEKVFTRLTDAKGLRQKKLSAFRQVALIQRDEGKDSLKRGSATALSTFPIEIGDYTFNLSPTGEYVYAYVLNNGDLRMKVSLSSEGPHPNVYVEFKSLFILENGADRAAGLVRNFVSSNFGEIKEEKVSRVEMYCDLAGAIIYKSSIEEFVTRANRKATYYDNDKFTGFEFGKGHIRAKIYNKTEEIKKSHKEYMYSIWDGVEKGEEVWRIEFSFDRKLLRGFGVESFDDFKEVAGDIWRYLTEDWLSQRELDNENQTRRTPALLWEVVQGVREFFGKITGAVRKNKLIGEIEHSISQIRGCHTSVGARLYKLGYDVSKKRMRSLVDAKIDEQLAGVEKEDFTKEEIDALSEIGFAQEVYRKAVNL